MLTGIDRPDASPFVPQQQPVTVIGEEFTPHEPLVVRHILAPFDGSTIAECTLPFVEALARTFSARVTLLHVLENGDAADSGKSVDSLEWEMTRIEALSELSRLQKKIAANGGNVHIDVVQGRAAEQIVHFAAREDVDMIVLATHGAGGLHDWNLCGTVQKIINRTEASVLLVPANRFAAGTDTVKIGRMLVPLDCSPRAECILPAATELAKVHGAELLLAHVVTEPEMPRRLSPSGEDLALVEKLVDRNRSEAKHYLEEIRGRLSAGANHVETRLLTSARPAFALRQLALEEHVDLVVLCAHGNTGDARRRFGEVPAEFLRECEEPVIIIQDLAQRRTETRRSNGERPGH